MSDSGNGTVTPDCEVAPDAKEFKQKPNNGFREMRNYRGNYRTAERGAFQGTERNDQRNYPANRVPNGVNNNFPHYRGGNFPRRRGGRFGPGPNMGTHDGSPRPDYWQWDTSPVRFFNYQRPNSFTYEPGVSRRPGPTTLGFIFRGK
ncbi:hypothetical protein COOONC_01193 [Cooperia oncophora]